MRRVIAHVSPCPLARECGNNPCLLRMVGAFNYPVSPSIQSERDKARDIEKRVGGKGYVPMMETRLREGELQIICPDFKNR